MSIDGLPIYLLALSPARLAIWPVLGGVGATFAMALREGRRKAVLNECLHELRRPLQALVLLAHRDVAARDGFGDGSVEMAAAALARLEREINGGGEELAAPRETFAARPLLERAARRWRPQATMRGKRLALRWDADEAVVEGDRLELAAALDNLVANALEHGGERIELAGDLAGAGICIAVVDTAAGGGHQVGEGSPSRREDREPAGGRVGGRDPEVPGLLDRVRPAGWPSLGRFLGDRRDRRVVRGDLSGRASRGHGLRLVRRAAVRHGGAFALHRGMHGTSAVLELPLAPSRWSEPRSPADAGSQDGAGRSATTGDTAAGGRIGGPGAPPSSGEPRPDGRPPEIVIRREAR